MLVQRQENTYLGNISCTVCTIVDPTHKVVLSPSQSETVYLLLVVCGITVVIKPKVEWANLVRGY